MSNWVRIRSWHLIQPGRVSRANGLYTWCGRFVGVNPALVNAPPETEATCEVCFRLREQRGVADAPVFEGQP